jgi:hypothetical protein
VVHSRERCGHTGRSSLEQHLEQAAQLGSSHRQLAVPVPGDGRHAEALEEATMTKSLTVLATVAATLAIAAVPAGAARAPDITAGSGLVQSPFGGTFAIHVNAASVDRAAARGRFWLDFDIPAFATFKQHGTVTCHTVSGARATVGGSFDELVSFGPLLPGPFAGILIFIEDAGQPGRGADTLRFQEQPQAPSTCPLESGGFAISQGNYVVRDR